MLKVTVRTCAHAHARPSSSACKRNPTYNSSVSEQRLQLEHADHTTQSLLSLFKRQSRIALHHSARTRGPNTPNIIGEDLPYQLFLCYGSLHNIFLQSRNSISFPSVLLELQYPDNVVVTVHHVALRLNQTVTFRGVCYTFGFPPSGREGNINAIADLHYQKKTHKKAAGTRSRHITFAWYLPSPPPLNSTSRTPWATQRAARH